MPLAPSEQSKARLSDHNGRPASATDVYRFSRSEANNFWVAATSDVITFGYDCEFVVFVDLSLSLLHGQKRSRYAGDTDRPNLAPFVLQHKTGLSEDLTLKGPVYRSESAFGACPSN